MMKNFHNKLKDTRWGNLNQSIRISSLVEEMIFSEINFFQIPKALIYYDIQFIDECIDAVCKKYQLDSQFFQPTLTMYQRDIHIFLGCDFKSLFQEQPNEENTD